MVEIKLNAGKSIQISAAADGKGMTLAVKTLFGTFSDQMSAEQAGGIVFAIEQAFDQLAVIQARDALKHANAQH